MTDPTHTTYVEDTDSDTAKTPAEGGPAAGDQAAEDSGATRGVHRKRSRSSTNGSAGGADHSKFPNADAPEANTEDESQVIARERCGNVLNSV